MMITFSTSRHVLGPLPGQLPHFTLYSVARAGPRRHRSTVLRSWKIRDHARDHRQPEREGAVDEHGDDGEPAVDAERRERADHPAVDAADAARQRQQVAEHPDEERLARARPAAAASPNASKRGPQHGDLEGPEHDRAEQRRVARAQTWCERVADARRRRGGQRARAAAASRPMRPLAPRDASERGARGRSARARSRARARVAISASDRRDDGHARTAPGRGRSPKRSPKPQTTSASRVGEVGEDEERDRLVGHHAAAHARRAAAPTPSARRRRRRRPRRGASPPGRPS